jgi:hypothetical protein
MPVVKVPLYLGSRLRCSATAAWPTITLNAAVEIVFCDLDRAVAATNATHKCHPEPARTEL